MNFDYQPQQSSFEVIQRGIQQTIDKRQPWKLSWVKRYRLLADLPDYQARMLEAVKRRQL